VLGLVPTMGALHQGHLSLIRQKHMRENEVVWVSIFVNPTQFNNPDDLENILKVLTDVAKAIQEIDANIHIFAPTVTEMYPDELIAKDKRIDGLR
jgi:pantoate--beta-alanine ligase